VIRRAARRERVRSDCRVHADRADGVVRPPPHHVRDDPDHDDLLHGADDAQTNQTQAAANAETSLWTVKVPSATPRPRMRRHSPIGRRPRVGHLAVLGLLPPSFDPAMPAVAALGNTAKAAGGAAYGVLGSPADDAILVAHDFDVVFCAPSNHSSFTSAPNIYRLWVNPTTCTNRTTTGGGGCTLQLDNYAPTPSPTCAVDQRGRRSRPPARPPRCR